jgi:hypothetical protein
MRRVLNQRQISLRACMRGPRSLKAKGREVDGFLSLEQAAEQLQFSVSELSRQIEEGRVVAIVKEGRSWLSMGEVSRIKRQSERASQPSTPSEELRLLRRSTSEGVKPPAEKPLISFSPISQSPELESPADEPLSSGRTSESKSSEEKKSPLRPLSFAPKETPKDLVKAEPAKPSTGDLLKAAGAGNVLKHAIKPAQAITPQEATRAAPATPPSKPISAPEPGLSFFDPPAKSKAPSLEPLPFSSLELQLQDSASSEPARPLASSEPARPPASSEPARPPASSEPAPSASPELAARPPASPELAARPPASPELAARPPASPELAARPPASPELAARPLPPPAPPEPPVRPSAAVDEKSQQQIRELNRRCAELEVRNQELEATCNRLKAGLQETESTLKRNRAVRSNLENDVISLQDQLTKARSRIEALEREIQHLGAELERTEDAHNSELRRLRSKTDRTVEEREPVATSTAQPELEALRAQMTEKDRLLAQEYEQRATLRSQLEDKQQKYFELKARYDKEKSEWSELLAQALQNQGQLRQQLEEMKARNPKGWNPFRREK